MRVVRSKLIFSLATMSMLVSSCATQPPSVQPLASYHPDPFFGMAVNTAKAQQILNPNAWQDQRTVAGIDGRAAEGSFNSYLGLYREPIHHYTVSTGAGNGSGGGGGGSF